jgi:hypothetical protein
MFAAIRHVAFSAQLGPHETFAELQAAASGAIPGAVLIPPVQNSTQGRCKGAGGEDLGLWHGPPFVMAYPVAFTAYIGPFETLDELQVAVSHQVPGAALVLPVKHLLGASDHLGEVRDSAGHNVGQWIEVR